MIILHIIDSDGIYGAEVMLLNLMSEQKKIGHRPILLSLENPDSTEASDLIIEAKNQNLETIQLELARGYHKSHYHRINKVACKYSVDVIHSHGYKSNILLGSTFKNKRNIPIVVTAHGWTSVRVLSKIWLYTILDKIAVRRLDAVVYVNPTLDNPIKHSNSYHIANGIKPYYFEELVSSNTMSPPIDQDLNIVGTILRLSEEKGVIYLLKSIKRLVAEGYAIKLFIIGDGPMRQYYEEYIHLNSLEDNIKLLGYKSNIYQHLILFDIFVLPSLTEGLPITILEAMQSSVPIIATSVGAIPLVLENGKYGMLVQPANVASLVDALKYCLMEKDECLTKAKLAREHALNNYSSESMALSYIDVYHDVIARY